MSSENTESAEVFTGGPGNPQPDAYKQAQGFAVSEVELHWVPIIQW